MSKKTKALLLGAMVAFLAPAALTTPVAAQDKTVVDFLGARYGAYSFTVMYAATAILNKNSDTIRGVVQEAFGAADNLKRLDQDKELRKHAFAVTTIPAMYGALQGKPKELFPTPITGMKQVFNQANFCTWMATTDPNVKTIEDLAGKKFDAGPYGNFMGIIGDSILEAYGVKDKVGQLLHTADQPAQYDGFTNGKVDGILAGSTVAGEGKVEFNGTVQKLLAARKVYPISLSKEKVKGISKLSGIPFSACEVAAGSSTPDAPAFISTQFAGNVVAHEDMPEDLVYQIMKQIIEHVDEFGKYSAQAKEAMSKESLAAINVPVADFHPGAIKAYREAGLKIGEENFQ
jgi:uncharacterized protein